MHNRKQGTRWITFFTFNITFQTFFTFTILHVRAFVYSKRLTTFARLVLIFRILGTDRRIFPNRIEFMMKIRFAIKITKGITCNLSKFLEWSAEISTTRVSPLKSSTITSCAISSARTRCCNKQLLLVMWYILYEAIMHFYHNIILKYNVRTIKYLWLQAWRQNLASAGERKFENVSVFWTAKFEEIIFPQIMF